MPTSPRTPAAVHDPVRLAALDGYGILDTPPEEGFDDIVMVASQACQAPVALVSLVAGDRQWFKARVGFPHCETDLGSSVCAHALGGADLLVIPDLAADPRTRANPLVTGEPHIRFYAGAPLVSPSGAVLGSLCVIDHAPRPDGLSERQGATLQALARQVVSQLELRRALADRERDLGEREALTETQATAHGAGGDLDAVLAALVAGAMRALPHAEGGVVELLEGDELVYRSPAGSIADMAGLRLPLRGSLAGSCALTGEAMLCRDALADDRVRRDLVERLRLGSCIVVPVRVRGRVIGVLKLQSSRVGAFTQRDLAVLRPFAGVVTAGLSQAGEATARREARASESRYKAVFDSAIDYAIIVMDRDGTVTDWNEGATRILGWEPGSMCGKPVDTFFTPEDRAAGIPGMEMRSALETGRGADERWHLRENGERFWANGEMMVLRDGDDAAIGFVKMLRDRTEQRRSAEALQNQADLLRTVTDHVGEALFQMDATGVVTFANPVAEAMFGWPVGEMLGRSLHDLLHHTRPDGSPYPAGECPLRHALVDGRMLEAVEDTFFRRDGTPVLVRVTNAPVRIDGRVASAVLTVTDITVRKAAERRRSALLELGDRLRDLGDRDRIALVAAEILGRTLDLTHAGYGAVDVAAETVRLTSGWNAPGAPDISGTHRFRDYGSYIEDLRTGATVTVADAALDLRTASDAGGLAAIGIRSILNIPVMEHGRFVALFYALGGRPRAWTADDVAFVREVADRTRTAIARAEAEERRDLLNHELSHRMKNLLAMVQAIATQTLRNAGDVDGAREVLEGRLVALGKAHDLLMGGALTSTEMEPVIRGALNIHADTEERFRLDGPPVSIGPDAALSLSLTLHELATNAAKYGALSTGDGHVDIRWAVRPGDADPTLMLSWAEVGGPPVRPPTRTGFGSRFIRRGLSSQVGGTLAIDYPASGVTFRVEAPLASFQASHEAQAA